MKRKLAKRGVSRSVSTIGLSGRIFWPKIHRIFGLNSFGDILGYRYIYQDICLSPNILHFGGKNTDLSVFCTLDSQILLSF